MTRLLFIKLLRDLRAASMRIVLMIVAMSLSLVVFSAVLYTRGITGREIARSYLSTNPASATLRFAHPLAAAPMAALTSGARTRPGVIDATSRTQLTLQVQQREGGWGPNPLQLFVSAPSDPMRMETFRVEQGQWPPAAGEILMEQGTLALFGLAVGDTVIVKAHDGGPASLKVSGVVHNPSLAPSFQEQKGHGYISTAALARLRLPVALDELKIQVADPPGQPLPAHDWRRHLHRQAPTGQLGPARPSRNRSAIVTNARELAGWLQKTYGVVVREIQVPTPYAHPHQAQLDMLLAALFTFGTAGLMLSAVLVATMLNGLFTQQIPQIGILKAIGAGSDRMFQFYLLMTLMVAATATALALVPGIAISRAWAPAILTGLLGMDAASLAPPAWMYAAVLVAGMGVPLFFALVPLVMTSRTTVRTALDHRGSGRQGVTATRFDAALARIQGLDRLLLMVFRNCLRRRSRFVLSVGLLASAGTLFVAGMSTLAGMEALLEQARSQRHWDVEVQLTQAQRISAAVLTQRVAQIPHVTQVEAWSIIPAGIAQPGLTTVTGTFPDQGHGSLAVAVIPPGGTGLMPQPPLLEGRWLRPGELDAVVISQSVRASALPGVHSGDTVQLSIGGRPSRWRVAGISQFLFGSAGIFATAEGFAQAHHANRPNVLRIVTDQHDEPTRTMVANAAERALTDAAVLVRSSASVSRFNAAGTGHMLPIVVIFLATAVSMGVVGCVGLASTMSTNVLERTREFGVMHAIGASAAAIRRIVVTEGIVVALASCLAAAGPAMLLTAAMNAGLGRMFLFGALPFRISAQAVIVWIVAVVIAGALATLPPAARASRLSVREALSYQ